MSESVAERIPSPGCGEGGSAESAWAFDKDDQTDGPSWASVESALVWWARPWVVVGGGNVSGMGKGLAGRGLKRR